MLRVVCVVFILTFMVGYSLSALTEAQMKSTAKLMRNTCQPKSKVSNEQIDKMHKGIWEFDKPAGCYMYCVLKMLKVVGPDGQLDVELAAVQMPTLPEPRREPTMKSIFYCNSTMSADDYNDKCTMAFDVAKCFYNSNPANYFLP